MQVIHEVFVNRVSIRKVERLYKALGIEGRSSLQFLNVSAQQSTSVETSSLARFNGRPARRRRQ